MTSTSDAATAAAAAESPSDVAVHALVVTEAGLALHSMQGLAAGSLRALKSCRPSGKVLAAYCCAAEGVPAVAVLERSEEGVCPVVGGVGLDGAGLSCVVAFWLVQQQPLHGGVSVVLQFQGAWKLQAAQEGVGGVLLCSGGRAGCGRTGKE